MAMHNPPHPGEFIRATYIEPFDISIRSLAESLGVSPSTSYRRFNSGIYAAWSKLRTEDAIDQWERDIGDRPQHVWVIVQFSLSPLAEHIVNNSNKFASIAVTSAGFDESCRISLISVFLSRLGAGRANMQVYGACGLTPKFPGYTATAVIHCGPCDSI